MGGRELALTTPAQRLLAYLALRDRPVLRDHAAEELWLDASQEHALGSLRSALWRLRQPRCPLLNVSGCRLELAPTLVVDVHEALSWARGVLTPSRADDGCDVRGLAHLGDILPDWYDDWVTLERERFRLLRVQALEELCNRLTRSGRHLEALEAALAAVRAEPLRESAQRALMRLHLAQGNAAEAVDQYRRFSSRLDRELGLVPSDQMRRLLGQVHTR